MRKSQKPEPVNLAEFARRAHVSPSAVQGFLRKQEARGEPVPTVSGAHRKERLVDMNHPAVRRYLQNLTAQPGNRAGVQPPTEAALEKLRAQCEKAELSAAAMRDQYISRDLVLQYIVKRRSAKRGESWNSPAPTPLKCPPGTSTSSAATSCLGRKMSAPPNRPPGNMAKRDKAAAPPPETASAGGTDTALPVLLRERRDRAMARRLTVQNQIIKGDLALREIVKLHLGKISGAYRAVVLEHSYSSVPPILAILRIRDPGADARLRLFLDDEAYSTVGRINRALDKWLRSRGTSNAE
jgi:hypothetical protein